MRLNLPIPTIRYKYFILKVDQINMMKTRGYLIEKNEKFLINESLSHDIRLEYFDKLYKKNGSYNRAALNKTYIPRDNRMKEFVDIENLYDKDDITQLSYINKNELLMKVYFSTKSEAKKLKYDILIENMKTPLNINVLIISDEIPLAFSSSDMDKIKSSKFKLNIKILNDEQITFDVRQHSFSTQNMKKLSQKKKHEFLNKEGIKGRDIRHILVRDPICIYMGWKIGDIIKVRRDNVFTNYQSSSISYLQVSKQQLVSKKEDK